MDISNFALRRGCEAGKDDFFSPWKLFYSVSSSSTVHLRNYKKKNLWRLLLLQAVAAATTCHGWRSTGPARSLTLWVMKMQFQGSKSLLATATCPISYYLYFSISNPYLKLFYLFNLYCCRSCHSSVMVHGLGLIF